MNVALWIVQGTLLTLFLLAGAPKIVAPIAALSKRVGWIGAVPAGLAPSLEWPSSWGQLDLSCHTLDSHAIPSYTVRRYVE